MYGIEYSTLANLIKDDDEDDFNLLKSKKTYNRQNSNEVNILKTTSNLSENLLLKLQNLKKCPEYLLPKTTIKNASFVSNTQTSISKAKSYYTDDFILLSEFSEIEGPKPL